MRRPPLVLADEPTGNLDTAAAADVFELMRRFNRELGTTFLVVTHDLRIAGRCRRILALVDGRIAGERAGDRRTGGREDLRSPAGAEPARDSDRFARGD